VVVDVKETAVVELDLRDDDDTPNEVGLPGAAA